MTLEEDALGWVLVTGLVFVLFLWAMYPSRHYSTPRPLKARIRLSYYMPALIRYYLADRRRREHVEPRFSEAEIRRSKRRGFQPIMKPKPPQRVISIVVDALTLHTEEEGMERGGCYTSSSSHLE